MKKLTSCLPFNKVHFLTFTIFLLLIIISLSKPASYSLPPLLLLLFSSQIVVQLRFFTHLPVYVVDYACLNPPSNCRIPSSLFLEHVVLMDIFNKESISYMGKSLSPSGQSDQTVFHLPPKPIHGDGTEEAQMLLFPVMDDLFSRTKLSSSDIDVLIVTCSAFSHLLP